MDANERLRQLGLLKFERQVWEEGYDHVAGIDEAGRGPLAGPVVAAACILPKEYLFACGIDDSKKLTSVQRATLFEQITNDPQIIYAVGIVKHDIIDQINILMATQLAMKEALDNLSVKAQYLLVDGLRLYYNKVPCKKIIKGDRRSLSIATASIIAKETRDRLMKEHHIQWPQYAFDTNKGYGTKKHCDAIKEHGPCPIHRRSFAPIKN